MKSIETHLIDVEEVPSVIINLSSEHKGRMSGFDGVVGGKLKLKGKALDVKTGGVRKKKKHKKQYEETSLTNQSEMLEGENADSALDTNEEGEKLNEEGKTAHIDTLLTPAEKRYIEQRAQLDVNKLAKTAKKSHRDRIEDFNQYLANMSEHYDIPKILVTKFDADLGTTMVTARRTTSNSRAAQRAVKEAARFPLLHARGEGLLQSMVQDVVNPTW
ncbi:hypothetical protein V2J09_003568 [Rumex salicifolius]